MTVVPMKGKHHDNWRALLSSVAEEAPEAKGLVAYVCDDGSTVIRFTHLSPERMAWIGAKLLAMSQEYTHTTDA